MSPFLRTTLSAALAALLLHAADAAPQAPSAPKPPVAPAAATLPPFETEQTNPVSWMGRFGATNCSWFDMGDGIFLLDTGATAEDAKNLLAEVKRTCPGKPVRWIAMTHLHADSNNGFTSMLPTDITLIVNDRAVESVQTLVRGVKGKAPVVFGVSDRLVLVGKTQTLEIRATPAPAHTNYDLWVWASTSGVAYVGDLVTPTRCPMTSDPGTDPKGWIAVLDTINALHPVYLVPTRGPSTTAAAEQIQLTRSYLNRLLEILLDMKGRNAPEARVSGEIAARRISEYCPIELDTINALALYRRMTPDGSFPLAMPVAPPPAVPAPRKK